MSDCDLIQVHLAARAAGEELGETAAAVDRHLRHCPHCREEAARLEETVRGVGGLADAPAPGEDTIDWEGFRARTLARAAGRPGDRRRVPWPTALALGAAALLVVALVPMVLSPVGRDGRGPGPGGDAGPVIADAPRPGPALSGPEAGAFLDGLERARSRRQTARLLRSGRALLVQLAASPDYCDRDRRSVLVERDVSLRLLRRKEVLDPALRGHELGRTRHVCDDLEQLLRAVAILEDCPDPNEVRAILDAATGRDLLPRIDAALEGLAEEGGRLV